MITLLRTDSNHQHFIHLVQQLDAYLAVIDGEDHSFYKQFNKTSLLKHAVVAYEDGEPVGCGAIKAFDDISMEVKRMYTSPNRRGKRIASQILAELERWAAETGYKKCVLETGKRMPDAIALYQKNGYVQIANYGSYVGIENSVCFEKKIVDF